MGEVFQLTQGLQRFNLDSINSLKINSFLFPKLLDPITLNPGGWMNPTCENENLTNHRFYQGVRLLCRGFVTTVHGLVQCSPLLSGWKFKVFKFNVHSILIFCFKNHLFYQVVLYAQGSQVWTSLECLQVCNRLNYWIFDYIAVVQKIKQRRQNILIHLSDHKDMSYFVSCIFFDPTN